MYRRKTPSPRRRRVSRSAASSPQSRSPRSSAQFSRRASLASDDSDNECTTTPIPQPQRSPQESLSPEAALETYYRSPRHSLVPEVHSPRYSITPDANRNYNRNNLVVDAPYGSRLSLNPQDFNRSPRSSLTPDATARSPRRSLVPEGMHWNNPRNSLVPDVGRSPRHSVAYIQIDPARNQKELGPNRKTSPRGSIAENTGKTKYFEANRSPRGSLIPDSQSPRGSIAQSERSTRGSLVPSEGDMPRTTPRSSLTLTFKEPLAKDRRSSVDSLGRVRGSPYRAPMGARSVTGSRTDVGSRRASSSISQLSGDEQRRLCREQSIYNERADPALGLRLGVGLTSCDSLAYQLKDANREATGTYDFICRAVRIMNRTIMMTVFISTLLMLPIITLIMGVQHVRDCPAEPRIPIYMMVGGSAGLVAILWLLYGQLVGRGGNAPASILERLLAYMLTVFLLGLFLCGNIWTMGIMWPNYSPARYHPNRWCHRALYVFTLVQLAICWALLALVVAGLMYLVICKVVRAERSVRVQEVLSQAENDVDGLKNYPIPEINEPNDDERSSVNIESEKVRVNMKNSRCKTRNIPEINKNWPVNTKNQLKDETLFTSEP